MARSLADLDDRELLGMVRSLAGDSGSRAAACELLVSRHRNLVRSCVQRYRGGTEPAEDLMQVGYVGLMKAISHFDPAAGTNLVSYARVCISGEIKRHFRDKCRPVYVKRSVKELVLEAREATRQLTQDLGRAPTEAEMARHLGVSRADLQDARRAELAYRPSSLDTPCQASQVRPPWQRPSARRTAGWSTCSACGPSPRTGASCPGGSSRSC